MRPQCAKKYLLWSSYNYVAEILDEKYNLPRDQSLPKNASSSNDDWIGPITHSPHTQHSYYHRYKEPPGELFRTSIITYL